MSRGSVMNLSVDEVEVPDGRRALDADAVRKLAASIKLIGLQHPITVRRNDGRLTLVAGHHRLAAVRSNGEELIAANIVKLDDVDARLCEIAENLHRAELSVQERADQIAEWVRLVEEKRVSRQLVGKPEGGRPEGGAAAAARELGVGEREVQRSVKIASISERAREAAVAAHLDNNQSALLKIASSQPAEQVERVRQLAAERDARRDARSMATVPLAADPISDEDAVEKQFARLMSAWNAACPEARQRFDDARDRPVMDRARA